MAAVRSRRTSQFLVTVGPVEYYDDIRSDLLDYFEGVKEYCVSVEKYHTSDYINKVHLHCYLEFYDLFKCVEVRECVSWFERTVNVESVKSKRNVLLYITKEDEFPLFNCREALLAFQYRARAWARRTPRFSANDAFVLEHTNKYRVLQELHREIRIKLRRVKGNYPAPAEWWSGWRMLVLSFIRERLAKRQSGKALYLWGPPGTGKTYVVEQILQMYSLVPYMPIPGQFFMGDFCAGDADVILFEEWSWETYAGNKAQIKRLLEGKVFSRDTKFSARTTMSFKGLVIIISNEPSPAYHEPAFERRLCIVEADKSYNESPQKVPYPKDENDAPEEVVEVSSDEEEDSFLSEAAALVGEISAEETRLQKILASGPSTSRQKVSPLSEVQNSLDFRTHN